MARLLFSSLFVIKKDDGNVVSVKLDVKNLNATEALEHLPPEQLVESILSKEKRTIEIMGEIKKVLRSPTSHQPQ